MKNYSLQLKNQNKAFIRIIKLVAFFTIVFTIVFCITWQNIQVYLYKRKIDILVSERNKLEKDIYLLNIKTSSLKSRTRIAKIAINKLSMVNIKPSDIRLIIY